MLPFTPKATTIIGIARAEATRLEQPYVADGHLFYALLLDEDSLACRVLRDQGCYESVLQQTSLAVAAYPTEPPEGPEQA